MCFLPVGASQRPYLQRWSKSLEELKIHVLFADHVQDIDENICRMMINALNRSVVVWLSSLAIHVFMKDHFFPKYMDFRTIED